MFLERMAVLGINWLGQQDSCALWANQAQMASNIGLLQVGRGQRHMAVGADDSNHGELLFTVILYSKHGSTILYEQYPNLNMALGITPGSIGK